MNYDKLKSLITTKNLSIQKACVAIGRSEGWFHNAVKKDTMTISDLDKLLKLCKSNLNDFFCQTGNEINEPKPEYIKMNTEVTELLRENRQLRIKIDELEAKRK